MWIYVGFKIKVGKGITQCPNGTWTYDTHIISGFNGPVSECPPAEAGTIIIQTVHIIQDDSAVTGPLPDGAIGDVHCATHRTSN
jgi:hypothetical protein